MNLMMAFKPFVPFVFAVVTAAFAVQSVNAQIVAPPTFTITPSNPTPNDVIHVHVNSGQLCRPQPTVVPTDGVEAQVVGAEINIVLSVTSCPNPSFSTYAFDVDLGALPPGLYEIVLDARMPPIGGPPPTYRPTELLGSTTFLVARADVAVPTLGAFALAALVSALALASVLALRGREP